MAKLHNIVEKNRSLFVTLRFVFEESFKGARKYSWLRLVFHVLGAAFSFIEFGALAMIVNEFVVYGVADARAGVLLGGLALLVGSNSIPEIIASFQGYFENTWNNDMSRYLQGLVVLKMRELDIGTIEQPEVQNIIETVNTRGWGSFFQQFALATGSLRNVVAIIIAAVSLVLISPWVLVIIFVGALPTFFFNKKNSELTSQVWEMSRELSRGWRAKDEPLFDKTSLTEIKNLNLVKIFLNKWSVLIGVFHERVRIIRKKKIGFDVLAEIVLAGAFGTSFFILIHQVSIGVVAVGSLVFSVSVVSRFQSGMSIIFGNFSKMFEHKRTLNSVLDLLEMEPLVHSGPRLILPEDFKMLEIRNISFGYPGSESLVIENMSLRINHKDSLAIVGLNGAGKTTLIRLLTRVYDPTEGVILVNGINLKEYDLTSWRKCLGILLQDYSIYSEESITENIMLGDTSKHDQDLVESVARETTADVFIQELPEKYLQRVGTEFQGGVELSKGQKQKLALARVLYRNAPIMVLDEPTSAIDALSEDTIFKSLKNNHADQTRIIISHKFSNVRDADKIILIEHGKIIEEGNHEQLMKKRKGKYKELFNLQAEGYR